MAKQKKLVPSLVPDIVKSSFVSSTGALFPRPKNIDEKLTDLLADVQKNRIYPDGKTFVDLVPRKRAKWIRDEYAIARKDPNFDLYEFVKRHFYELGDIVEQKDPFIADPKHNASEQVSALWEHLERRNRIDRGSLLALPYPYIVPGGRFDEQYYWDSYFIMLGLASEGKYKMIEGMLKNNAYMLRKFGFIPTGNRTYFLSRSQPPFFAAMVKLLQKKKGKRILVEYLPYLITEYRFWMKGRTKLAKAEHRAIRRVVEMPNGVHVNRYFDNKVTPRPESLFEDVNTVVSANSHEPDRLFLHLRAAAESGWDFSSRWFTDPKDIRTIHTADIVPVDLNCLLYELETTIADAYKALAQPLFARRYQALAERRAHAIQHYMWNDESGFFEDYNFHHRETTSVLSLAGVFPLYVGIATDEQAKSIAAIIKNNFLKSGGLITTLEETSQQWDAPNGWAPLQWITIQGLRRYGYDELADTIKKRWLLLNERVFVAHHKMIEKYNVENETGLGGGGEYPLQDGFGWTNGVYEALKNE